jgi:hypothetical protein
LCLNGNCLIVDFPPVSEICRFNLGESCCIQLWPARQPAGTKDFNYNGPARVDRVLLALCQSIIVQVDAAALHA